ncbi:MAG: RNA polymerase subunit sigma-70, partial [Pseudonocardiaceae bacterium]
SEVRGAAAVAGTFWGRAQAADLALVNGSAGAVWAPGGRPRVVLSFAVTGGKIVAIHLLADSERLAQLSLDILKD